MKHILITAVLLAGGISVADAQDGNWTVMITTENGQVSVVKGLTEENARQIAQRKTPYWQRPDVALPRNTTTFISPGDVREVEAWGPGGKNLDVWPAPAEMQDVRKKE